MARPRDYNAKPRDYKARPRDYKARLRDCKTRLRDYKARLCDYKARLRDYKARLRDYRARLRDYKARLRDYKARPLSRSNAQPCSAQPPNLVPGPQDIFLETRTWILVTPTFQKKCLPRPPHPSERVCLEKVDCLKLISLGDLLICPLPARTHVFLNKWQDSG